ncbi:hypothetical protein TNCV_2218411 [Trichonephila clavipes]|nr:hypothetical protein TNCV_2218411 [Trichonephila clavipes]
MIKAATEIVEKKQNLSSDIVKCGISVDGTWQRRGYTSMNGCVAAISVDTGKVLDIELYVVLLSNINVDNLTAMQQNVIAALYHCASSYKKPIHG